MSSIGSCVIYRSCLNLNLWNREIDLVIALSWSWSLKLFWLRGICGISEVNYRFIYHGLTRHSLVFLPLCWPLYLLIFSRSAATLLISLIGGNKETETPLKRISLTQTTNQIVSFKPYSSDESYLSFKKAIGLFDWWWKWYQKRCRTHCWSGTSQLDSH